MATAVREAGRADRAVAVHAHPADAIKDATRAGAASIEQCTFFDEEALSLMSKTGTFMVATLSVYESIVTANRWPDLQDTARRVLDHKLSTVGAAMASGVRWGVGTDTGTYLLVSHYWREPNFNLHQKAGASVPQVLLLAIKVNSELLGLGDAIGTIEDGKLADLVALDLSIGPCLELRADSFADLFRPVRFHSSPIGVAPGHQNELPAGDHSRPGNPAGSDRPLQDQVSLSVSAHIPHGRHARGNTGRPG
jgi:hypothetical protein